MGNETTVTKVALGGALGIVFAWLLRLVLNLIPGGVDALAAAGPIPDQAFVVIFTGLFCYIVPRSAKTPTALVALLGLVVIAGGTWSCTAKQAQSVAATAPTIEQTIDALYEYAAAIKATNPSRAHELGLILRDAIDGAFTINDITRRSLCTDQPALEGCVGVIPFASRDQATRAMDVAQEVWAEVRRRLLEAAVQEGVL